MQALNKYYVSLRCMLWLVPIFMLASLSSCDDDEVCEEATANNLRIGFYPEGQDDEQFWATVDSLMVHSLEKPDKPVLDTLYTVSSIELPLNIHADSCAFVIDFFHTQDTLWLHYWRETHLISVECGFTVFFDLHQADYTTHYIESIHIDVPQVTNSLDEHIQIFIPDTLPGN